MEPARIPAARDAAWHVAIDLGLDVAEDELLQVSNRVVARLRPCDVVARVADAGERAAAERELALTTALVGCGAPVAGPVPGMEARAVVHDAFVVSCWTYHPPTEPRRVDPSVYADALARLHGALRSIDGAVDAPHYTERVARARDLISDRTAVSAIDDGDRAFLVDALDDSRSHVQRAGAPEQLLHGEPHGGNLLRTVHGPLFTDFEAMCVGPIELDVADVEDDVAACYPGLDRALHARCKRLVLAMVATWCWAGYDDHDNLRHHAHLLLEELRRATA